MIQPARMTDSSTSSDAAAGEPRSPFDTRPAFHHEGAVQIPPPRESQTSSSGARRLTIDTALLARVNQALDQIRDGKMVILVDDEDRENEGDLTMAAEKVTPEAINFMAKYGRGLICLTLTEEQVERLELPMMAAPGRNGPPLGTAFTMSIEARTGVTTGISAADRARTIQVAIDPEARPQDLVTPGHVFPLKARRGGVLVRTGQTEGSVDLARLAGLGSSGVICEIMNDDGTMARMPDLERFAKEHGLLLLSIADLIQYRMQTERLVRRIGEERLKLDLTGSEWLLVAYEIVGEPRQFLALVKGTVDPTKPVLCRVHSGTLIGDVFVSTRFDGGENLREAIRMIEAEGSGVILYIPPRSEISRELASIVAKLEPGPAPQARNQEGALREFGLGAQVLSDLGACELRLLTNNQTKIAGIDGFGLKVVERVPLKSAT